MSRSQRTAWIEIATSRSHRIRSVSRSQRTAWIEIPPFDLRLGQGSVAVPEDRVD